MENKADFITVQQFFEDNEDILKLTLAGGFNGLKNIIKNSYVNNPTLLFFGYKEEFPEGSVQILTKREISFLKTLGEEERKNAIFNLFSIPYPCIVITDNEKPPDEIKKYCNEKEIPLIITEIDMIESKKIIDAYLYDKLAKYIVINGTLVDVYGIGLLFTGESGIGKSETALDLISRGHRLIADDVVKLKRRGNIIIGEGIEPSEMAKYHMEIRGVGIVNIPLLFGIKSIRMHKRVEVIVDLVLFKEKDDWTRTGLEEKNINILGIELPYVQIPIIPGKNIGTISELVALNHISRIMGYDAPKFFNEELLKILKKQGRKIAMLEEDEE